MDSKIRSYDGTREVKFFLEKVSLLSSLKGYEGEKAAQDLASKLEGRASDVYMRLSATDKKSVEKIHDMQSYLKGLRKATKTGRSQFLN